MRARSNARRVWIPRLVSLALALLACALLYKTLLKSASGCAGVFSALTYTDTDEAFRQPDFPPDPTPRAFTDADYDRVNPGLGENP